MTRKSKAVFLGPAILIFAAASRILFVELQQNYYRYHQVLYHFVPPLPPPPSPHVEQDVLTNNSNDPHHATVSASASASTSTTSTTSAAGVAANQHALRLGGKQGPPWTTNTVTKTTMTATESTLQRNGTGLGVEVVANASDRAPASSDVGSSTKSVTASSTQRFTCGCPTTCDDVALSRINRRQETCQTILVRLMRENEDWSETDACRHAVEDGDYHRHHHHLLHHQHNACGIECHPVHCHNSSALAEMRQPLDWSRVETMDLPQHNHSTSSSLSSSPSFSSLSSSQPTTPSGFVRYDKVVVVTKTLGPKQVGRLKQMLCLFHAAYNRHVNYDIVVFSTLPWETQHIEELQRVVPDTKLQVVLDGPPLREQIQALTPAEKESLYHRCHVLPGEDITWNHHCSDGKNQEKRWNAKLGYAWQSEFRAYHIWKMPVLQPYKYMLWMDTDALCTKPWSVDPMRVMIENDLVLMFDNFYAGYNNDPLLLDKLRRAYQNRTLCDLTLDRKGRFKPIETCTSPSSSSSSSSSPSPSTHQQDMEEEESPGVPMVHGFHHITNLDFYRQETNLRFLEILVETHRFSREWDDQLAVTLPAAMMAPKRAWDYRRNGLNMGIYHNRLLDGKGDYVHPERGYPYYWEDVVKDKWDTGREMCDHLVLHNGR